MRICFISVLRSGTYFYTERLAGEMLKYGEAIIIGNKSFRRKPYHNSRGARVVESWRRNSPTVPLSVCATVKKCRCDIAIIQYEYSIFGRPLLSQILLVVTLKMLKCMNIRTAIALHGVLYPAVLSNNKTFREMLEMALLMFYRIIASLVDMIIVLNPLQKKLLENYGVNSAKIVVIPHGVEVCKGMSTASHRDKGEKIVMFHGFIRPSKGLLELMEAIRILNMKGLGVKLKIIGSLSYQFFERLEEQEYMRRVINLCKELRDKCVLKLGFHPINELLREALDSDIIVLPYKDRFVESSGVLHMFMDCGKPIIVSKTPRFLADVVPNIEAIAVDPIPEELAHALYKLICDKELYESVIKNLKQKAETRYWRNIAKEWFNTLRTLLEDKNTAKLT